MATNTDGGTTTSFLNSPQAVDDYYGVCEDYIYTFDVMSNDLGGSAKILWSIDDTDMTDDGALAYDLLTQDTAASVPEYSDLGAKISIVSGKIRYDASVFNYLAAGQSVIDTFTYAIRLSNGTLSWATVSVTITGTNDGPTVSAVDLAGAVIEDDATPNLTDTGTITFDDVDLTNTHTTSVTAAAGNTLGGTLTASVTDTATGVGDGTVTWNYSVANSATQYLAQGQTATETFTIRIQDNSGGYIDQVVVVTVTGTNDKPTVSVADLAGAATEDASSPNLTDTGTITFDDLDLIDTHSTNVTPAAGNTLGGTLTASVTDSATGAGDGTVTWNYSVANSATQYLAEGQTASETFTIRISDNNGGYIDQVVVVTITGANDEPDIRVESGDGASAPFNETDGGLSTSGSLTVTDADTLDTISTSIGLTSVTGPTGGLTNLQLLGMFSVTPSSGLEADTGDTNNLGWTFDSGSQAFNYLRAGQTLQLVYTLTVDDGNSGTDTQNVTITITGTNDAPVLSDTTDPVAVAELGDASAQNLSAITGSFSVTDKDVGDTLTASVVGSPVVLLNGGGTVLPPGASALTAAGAFTLDSAFLSSGGAQNVGYSYDPGAANLDFLRAGDSLTITYTIQVGDGTTNSSTQTVTFTITGTNDAPEASPVTLTAIAEDSGARLITQAELLAGATDVDNTTAELTITTLSIATGGGTLVDNLDGTWSYTPALNDDTSVTFNYTVSDGALTDSSTTSLDITPVNDAPEAQAATNSGAEDAAAIVGSVLGTDVDNDAGDLTYSLVADVDAAKGVLTFNADGTYSFVPAADFFGEVTFTYKASDGALDSNVATVTITVTPVNDAPVASPVTLTAIAEDSGPRIITQAELLAGVIDVDGPSLSITALSIAAGGNGSLVDNGNGTWTYTPALDDDMSVTFNYTASDGSLTSNSTATMDITPVADFVYVSPAPYTGTGDPNDFDALGNSAGQNLSASATNGNDTIYGGAGVDTINGGGGDDIIYGGSGADSLGGGSDGDQLYGGSGADTISGGNNNDRIIGGYGADNLTGSNGADTFVYVSNLDTGDTIVDFSQLQGDKIDLSAFAPTSFVGLLTNAGAVGPNQVGYMTDGTTTTIYVDTDGVFGADLEIKLTGNITLNSGDFILGGP